VLCFQEHLKVYYNSSTREQCTSVVSVVSPELTPGDIWLIQSEVVLERDCNYTVHVTSDSGAHKDLDSSGVFSINTRVVGVEVSEVEGEVVVRCVFRHTLSQRCYVQLVSSEVEGGFQEGGCVEGEGEGVHRFPGLLPTTYTVLVYGLAAGGGEDSCSPAPGDPDYITVATVYGPRPSSVNNQPLVTSLKGSREADPLCGAGVGIGLSLGILVTSLVLLVAIGMIKLLATKCTRKKGSRADEEGKVAMERNLAYELHKPRYRHKQPPQTTPVYEDLK
jgi:hypothetical protein